MDSEEDAVEDVVGSEAATEGVVEATEEEETATVEEEEGTEEDVTVEEEEGTEDVVDPLEEGEVTTERRPRPFGNVDLRANL